MVKATRIFVEKRAGFRSEAASLRRDLNAALGVHIQSLRLINIYDIFTEARNVDTGNTHAENVHAKNTDAESADTVSNEVLHRVFAQAPVDVVLPDFSPGEEPFLAVEYLPGQFDQRGASAEACIRLLEPAFSGKVRSAKLLVFDSGVSPKALEKIAAYYINPVECRRMDLSVIVPPQSVSAPPVGILDGFRSLSSTEAPEFCQSQGLAMSPADLLAIVDYFRKENRDPTETELRVLDTYWSDHCRHTTFNTHLTDIRIADGNSEISEALRLWLRLRKETGRDERPFTLMDLATIGADYLRQSGQTPDVDVTDENNACSITMDIDADGATEKWLLMFKNETHNHPTEIEPFGGAATCLGGAVRDPLSGRAFVYQAMRISGSGNIHTPVSDTLPGKLPQSVISKGAAAGFSSYGNQLGISTTFVREIFHPGYVAKRMEVGAVVGAVRAADIRRETPRPGDAVIMLGGRTGRDGIGGATGSSKSHNLSSLTDCGSEVQKGNAPEERKLQRLFRRPEATRLILRANDFGAGGVSVAVGELADGLDIFLDRIKTKYEGLSPTELAISESQERMAVVIHREDMETFLKLCGEENIEAVHVADITDSGRMRMFFYDSPVVDLARGFIDSAGSPRSARAIVSPPQGIPSLVEPYLSTEEKLKKLLSHPNVTAQTGLVEMFDASVGASTVLMPYGGARQATETQVSVQRLPVGNASCHAGSLMAFGFDPFLSAASPFHGAALAVVEAVAKAVAAGADFRRIRLSFQEYFERMGSPESWGKPLAALLGALKMQVDLGIPAIGGKDSMSGTFQDLNVPPTLIAFAVSPVDIRDIISPEFKAPGHNLYLLRVPSFQDSLPDIKALRLSYADLHLRIKEGSVAAAFALGAGGVAEAVCKMSFGNGIGAEVCLADEVLWRSGHGAIMLEMASEMPSDLYLKIGRTSASKTVSLNGEEFHINTLMELNRTSFADIYPIKSETKAGGVPNASSGLNKAVWHGPSVESPVAYLPIFPGTNCDYDMADAFARNGAQTVSTVFRDLSPADIELSLKEMATNIDCCHILALSGGFSAADEPDGSGKYIANVLMNSRISEAIGRLLARGGLILGICNGFQALVKSGLLPDGKISPPVEDSATLARNAINRHVSRMVTLRVGSMASPWLDGFTPGELFTVAASHGEGRFTAPEALLKKLASSGRIAFQYADPVSGNATMESPFNPNGSALAIDGILSPDGRILGMMSHPERYREGLMKNIPGNKNLNIFRNAINYFRSASIIR